MTEKGVFRRINWITTQHGEVRRRLVLWVPGFYTATWVANGTDESEALPRLYDGLMDFIETDYGA